MGAIRGGRVGSMERIAGLLCATIVGVVLSPIFKLVLKVPLRIAEDAISGWINQQIGKAFGMTSPSLVDIVQTVSEWGPAFFVALLFGWLMFLAFGSRLAAATPSGSKGEKPEFLRDIESDTAVEKIPVQRDIWLLDAIHRAATGEWKIHNFDELAGGKINEFVGVLEKVRQAAFDDDLPIWGKQAQLDIWRPIPREYWEYHGIDWFSMLKGEPENLKTESKKTTKNIGTWHSLMTSRQKVSELWPVENT